MRDWNVKGNLQYITLLQLEAKIMGRFDRLDNAIKGLEGRLKAGLINPDGVRESLNQLEAASADLKASEPAVTAIVPKAGRPPVPTDEIPAA